jgi:hypothetical protein
MTKLAADDPTNADMQVLAAAACAQVAVVDMMLKDRGDPKEAFQIVQEGLALLTGLEKRGAPPPQSVEIRKKLEWLERALPSHSPEKQEP